jgi:hypothetical protein
MTVFNGGKLANVCGMNKPCHKKSPEEEKADTFLMLIVNSLAILYLYNQFSNLRKAGSKYLLGIYHTMNRHDVTLTLQVSLLYSLYLLVLYLVAVS